MSKETHLLETDWDRHSSEASAPPCTVSINTEGPRVCVRARNNDWHLCVYVLPLWGGAADLWWSSDWAPWFTAPAKLSYRLKHAQAHTHTQPWHMFSDYINQRKIHNSVFHTVAHVNQVLIKTQCLLCRSDKLCTIHKTVSMRHHSDTHLWMGSSNIFLSLISVGSDKTLHIHLVSSGPRGATFHSVAGMDCMS